MNIKIFVANDFDKIQKTRKLDFLLLNKVIIKRLTAARMAKTKMKKNKKN